MANGNNVRNLYSTNDVKRLSVFYDANPTTNAEMDARICISLKSTGQVIRLNASEALDLIMDLSKALKRSQWRQFR